MTGRTRPILLGVTTAITCMMAFALIYNRHFNSSEPDWQITTTPHYTIHVEADSIAERDLEKIREASEQNYQTLATNYEFTPEKSIPLYVRSKPVIVNGKSVWGFVPHNGESVHIMYTDGMKDLSPHELRHYFHFRMNRKAPSFFDEGGANINVVIGKKNMHARLKEAMPDGPDKPLKQHIHEFKLPYNKEQARVAYSFCNFLADEIGETAFGEFYRKVTRENQFELLEDVTGRPLDDLETRWKAIVWQTIPTS